MRQASGGPKSYPPPPIHYPDGIETPRDFRNLTRRLLERGYSEQATKKILGGNWVRVFREVWANSDAISECNDDGIRVSEGPPERDRDCQP